MLRAYGEVVWSWRPLAGVKSVRSAMSALAGRTCCDLQATVTKTSWTPGRARRKPLKPLRGEGRDDPVEPVVTMLVCFHLPHARLRVQRAPGFPCALCF